MIHKRIRPFNTKDTYPEQKLDNDLCQAVVARGTMVFLRGQVPAGPRHGEECRRRRSGRADAQGDAEHPPAARASAAREMEHIDEARRLSDRHPPPRGGLPRDGRVHQGRASGLHRPRRRRRSPAPNGWSRSTRPPCIPDSLAMTFSIAARCPTTGMFGIADRVVVAGGRGALRACAGRRRRGSPARTSPTRGSGSRASNLLAAGRSADETLALLKAQGAEMIAYRQLAIVDRAGRTAAHSGDKTLGTHALAQVTTWSRPATCSRTTAYRRR